MQSENNPEDEHGGTRNISFAKELYIEQEDFMEEPPKKYFRLAPGAKVRLKNAYIIQCDEVIKNEDGTIKELRCSYIENSRSGSDTSGIAVKGTIHWVATHNALPIKVKLYDRLFAVENVEEQEGDFKDYINANSLQEVTAYAEAGLANATASQHFQFIRKGYFVLDSDSSPSQLVFNKTVGLKDSWAKAINKA
jgi:glutaminyl-tRNA synthetase